MAAKAKLKEAPLPVPPPKDSVAASEVSLYRGVLKIQKEHGLETLGIAFYDAQTTIQWSYNGDQYFHAASTMKLAVLLGVFRQIDRGELTLDAPVNTAPFSNRSCSTSGAMPTQTSTATSAAR